MDAQSALGPARPRRPRGVRHRTAVSRLARAAACDCGLLGSAGKGKFRACAIGSARRGQARPNADGILIALCAQKSGGRSLRLRLEGAHERTIDMLSPDQVCDREPLNRAAADYAVVRRAIAFVCEHWRAQPEIDAIAAAVGVSASELHHLFRRWASITPKAFLQALTLEHARRLLRDSASVLEAAFEVGLSGPGRLHDLFVTHEAMSPGEWKSGGAGLTMSYGFHPSPFGTALVMTTPRGLAGLAFADPGEEEAALADMKGRWPKADMAEDRPRTAELA